MENSLLSHCFLFSHLRFPSPSLRLFFFPSSRHVRPFEMFEMRELEGGMDPGLFKVILVGKVGQAPMQRRLRSDKEIMLFFLATVGIRNNCRLSRRSDHGDRKRQSKRGDLEERFRGER